MATMQPFTISLPESRTLTGLLSFPPPASHPTKGVPLIVTVHGGSYDASYYDADAAHSITRTSVPLSIPVISITRPGYRDSTPLPKLKKGESFMYQQGEFLHKVVLPALWEKYAKQANATGVVLHSHSIGAGIATITAAMHGQDSQPGYPLLGLVTTGIGAQLYDEPAHNASAGEEKDENLRKIDSYRAGDEGEVPTITWPVDVKDELMLRKSWHLCHPTVFATSARLNNPTPILEPADIRTTYHDRWRAEYAPHVRCPLLYGLAEHDNFWVNTAEMVEQYAGAFTASPRVERGIVPKAPHCIELSCQGPGWLARTLGFAMECAAADVLEREDAGPSKG
ncbi:hypothetical protein LTR50_003650 [Elasticomyces elasticus]|nr:hypothetical protein LTR50_003650 [Elasticomyces elasticus]